MKNSSLLTTCACVAWLLIHTACSTTSRTSHAPPSAPAWTTYGDPEVGPGDAVAIGALEGGEQDVVVTGTITEVCKIKGCWMKVKDEGGKEVFTKFKDYSFFVPRNSVGRTVVMHGWAEKKETSVADLRHYAEDAKKSPSEIAAITQPKTRIVFYADSVMVAGSGLDKPHVE